MIELAKVSPRIAIYGVGFIGKILTRFAVDKGWPVVAAYNRANEKVGRDLGQVAELGKNLGVVIEDADTADYASCKADIALIAITDRMAENMPAYERFLNQGINVLCHGGESYYPWFTNRDLTEKIERIAMENAVTFSGSGIWDSTRFWSGIIAAGPCVKIDAMEHYSLTDVARQGLHMLPKLGTGMTVKEFDEKVRPSSLNALGVYPQILVAVLEKMGYNVTNVGDRIEPILYDEPFFCIALDKELAPGTCIGTRVAISAETREGLTATGNIELRAIAADEEEVMNWSIQGNPSFHLSLRREKSHLASASSLFNRIPNVLSAPPGISTLMDYGPLIPSTQA